MHCAASFIIWLALGAPGPERDEEAVETVETVELTLDEARLMVERDLSRRGEKAYGAGDYAEAIEAWTEVLSLNPDKQVDPRLRVQLAHAHHRAYFSDNELEHLQVAHGLFTEELGSLEADNASRAELEVLLADIEAELDARAKAEAEAQARRDAAIREQQDRINREEQAKVEAERQRKAQRAYFGAGGAASGVGLGLLATMTASLVLGARLEREGQSMANTVGVADGFYAEQLAKGQTHNRIALSTGLIGGVISGAGVTLLCLAIVRRRSTRPRADSVHMVPQLDGFQLRF